jgi:tetratricopeptide (TPR) repeat protein
LRWPAPSRRRGARVGPAFTGRGNAYFAKGNHERAKADYDEAIRLDPKHAAAFNNRGNATVPKATTTAP